MQPPFRSPAVLKKESPQAALVSRKSSTAKKLFVSSAVCARHHCALKEGDIGVFGFAVLAIF